MDICVVGVMHSKFYQFTRLPWLLFLFFFSQIAFHFILFFLTFLFFLICSGFCHTLKWNSHCSVLLKIFFNWIIVDLQCCIYLFIFNFWLLPVACGPLSSLKTRDQALIPCIGRWSLSHWTTRGSVIAQPSCFTSAHVHDLLISQVCDCPLAWPCPYVQSQVTRGM